MYNIKPSQLRDLVVANFFLRLQAFTDALQAGNTTMLRDVFASIGIFGIPGVGKSVLPKLGYKDAVLLLSERRGEPIQVKEVSLRASIDEAKTVLAGLLEGKVAPLLHVNLPSTKIWTWEGTPSPQDYVVEVGGVKIAYNMWRVDPFLIPFIDVSGHIKPEKAVPPMLIMDEFNAVQNRQVLASIFQLARDGGLGRVNLNPLTLTVFVGNTPETNILVEEELPLPLLDRMIKYVVTKPDLEGWIAFMKEVYGDKWDRAVAAYLSVNPKDFYRVEGEKQEIVTPRRWTNVAYNLHAIHEVTRRYGLPVSGTAKMVVYGNLPPDVAERFWGFYNEILNLKRIRFDVDNVIKNPELLERMSKPTVAYLLLMAMDKLMKRYGRLSTAEKRERLRKIAELGYHARRVLGTEAYAIIIGSMPAPVRVRFARFLREEERESIKNVQERVRQLEEALRG